MGLGFKKPDDEPGAAWVAIVIGIFVAYVPLTQLSGGILTRFQLWRLALRI